MKFLISTILFVTMSTLAIAQEDTMIPKPAPYVNGGTLLGLGGDYAYVGTGLYSTSTPTRNSHPLIEAEADDYIVGKIKASAKGQKSGNKFSSSIDLHSLTHYIFEYLPVTTNLEVRAECKNGNALLTNLSNTKGLFKAENATPSSVDITGDDNQVFEMETQYQKFRIVANEVTESTIGNKKRIVKNAFRITTIETQYPSEYVLGHLAAEAECE